MATGTTISKFRKALVEELRTVVPVPVIYVISARGTVREAIYLGDSVDATTEDPTLKIGRRTRDETIDHYLEIQVARSQPEDAEERATELLNLVYDVVSEPTHIAAIKSASDVDWFVTSRVELSTQILDELSMSTTIRVWITSLARLQ